MQSVAAVETLGKTHVAAEAYVAALRRWPRSLAGLIGLGNTRYALADLTGAEDAFRRAIEFHPSSPAAYNNLAQTLADQRRYTEAETMARQAIVLGAGGPLSTSLQQTLDEILKKATRP